MLERQARHQKIVGNLTRRIEPPWRPPPKPRATYLKLRPGDRLELTAAGLGSAPQGSTWQVDRCDSEGMWLTKANGTIALGGQRWVGPWEGTFRKLPRPRTKKPSKTA